MDTKTKKNQKANPTAWKERVESFKKDTKQISWLTPKEAGMNTLYTALAMVAVGCFTFSLDMGLQALLNLIV